MRANQFLQREALVGYWNCGRFELNKYFNQNDIAIIFLPSPWYYRRHCLHLHSIADSVPILMVIPQGLSSSPSLTMVIFYLLFPSPQKQLFNFIILFITLFWKERRVQYFFTHNELKPESRPCVWNMEIISPVSVSPFLSPFLSLPLSLCYPLTFPLSASSFSLPLLLSGVFRYSLRGKTLEDCLVNNSTSEGLGFSENPALCDVVKVGLNLLIVDILCI